VVDKTDLFDKAAPVALKIWLAFLLIFVVLGYPVLASIFFGAIAGGAGGMVSAWWTTPGGEPVPNANTPLRQVGRRLKQGQEKLQRLPMPFGRPRQRQRYSRPRR